MFDSYVPCIPSIPSHFGSSAGKAPSPIRVEVIGKPASDTSWRSAALAPGPALITPPPV